MRSNNQIKGIFFDAGDTLFQAKAPIGLYYSQIAAKYGIEIDAKHLDQRFKTAFQHAPPLAFPSVEDDELACLEFEWWRRLVRFVFEDIDFPQFDLFFEAVYAFFESPDAWRLFPETKTVLASLQEAGFTLGIISNFDSRLIAICEHLDIRDYFTCIVFSSRENAAKPDPGIFKQTLRQTGLSPAESLHVGDSLENDVKGAKRAGMMPLLLDRLGVHPKTDNTIAIRDLHGISSFLQSKK